MEGKLLHEIKPEEWDLIFDTNLRGPYLMIRALAPLMIAARSGHIINISSLAGRNPLPKGAAYAASKWGLNGLTYSVAEELRQFNIRVSVVAPGSINTDFGDHSGRVRLQERIRKRNCNRTILPQSSQHLWSNRGNPLSVRS